MELDFNPLHTLGFLATDWLEAHCLVPGGVFEGEPLQLEGWQLFCTVNHYAVKPKAIHDPRRLVEPFVNRRSIVVGPQKCGKSPWGAGMILFEALGPALFAGFARGGEQFRCSDNGCGCGWFYDYLPGEAMGYMRRKSLIGLFAYAESQTQNVYEPLQSMIASGPLTELAKVGEGFIRLPNRGKIVPLTAAAKSKLGQPLTFALGDESGLYTRANRVLDAWQTIRRGVAGMQGRTLELTNPWDRMDGSAAQAAFESKAPDVFRYYRQPPPDLDYRRKADRRKIHKFVYADSPWVDPDSAISPEADELMETDPVSAERFFGNRLVQGLGSFLSQKMLDPITRNREIPLGTEVCAGFDGSTSDDWTAIRVETSDGHRFTPEYQVGDDWRPMVWRPEDWDGQIPRSEVHTAVAWLFANLRVRRFYADPRDWQTELDTWAQNYGDEVVVQWPTNQIQRMFQALNRYKTDLSQGATTHDPDSVYEAHALNARQLGKPGDKFILGKPNQRSKIDVLMADILAHEAACDMRKLGWMKKADRQLMVFR